MNNSFIEVYDNILTKEDADALENALICDHFPWFVQLKTVHDFVEDPRHRESIWMSHNFVNDGVVKSPNMQIPNIILTNFLNYSKHNYKEVIRITANKTQPTFRSPMPTPAHRDRHQDHVVLIYYAMDSDGDTVIYNNEEERKIIKSVSPCKNRFLFFSGNYWHASYLPREHDMRVVVNFNLAISTT